MGRDVVNCAGGARGGKGGGACPCHSVVGWVLMVMLGWCARDGGWGGDRWW